MDAGIRRCRLQKCPSDRLDLPMWKSATRRKILPQLWPGTDGQHAKKAGRLSEHGHGPRVEAVAEVRQEREAMKMAIPIDEWVPYDAPESFNAEEAIKEAMVHRCDGPCFTTVEEFKRMVEQTGVSPCEGCNGPEAADCANCTEPVNEDGAPPCYDGFCTQIQKGF
jgi:hypothetical protein